MVRSQNKLYNYLLKQYPDANFEEETFFSFTKVEEEYCTLKHGVGFIDKTNRTMLRLKGKDTLEFLHRISTNSVKELTIDEKKNTLFLNEKGRFIDRAAIISSEDGYLLIGSEGTKNLLSYWIERFIIMEDIKVEVLEGEYSIFEFFGPQTDSFFTMICGKEVEYLDFSKVLRVTFDGLDFSVMKFNEAGDTQKYSLIIKSSDSVKLVKYLFDNASVFDFKAVGKKAYEIFRVEKGIPEFPNEINDSYNPHEIGLIHEVDFNKGCYIGQEVIARLDTYDKVQRKLMGLINKNHNSIKDGIELVDPDENNLGIISSVAQSELLKKQIGLVLVRSKYLSGFDLNTKVMDKEGNELNLKLTELPFKK